MTLLTRLNVLKTGIVSALTISDWQREKDVSDAYGWRKQCFRSLLLLSVVIRWTGVLTTRQDVSFIPRNGWAKTFRDAHPNTAFFWPK